MHLAPRDLDKLVLHGAGVVAQKRLARGLRLNYPEAVALIATQILELIRELQTTRRMAVLVVTHDWGVVADLCDRVVVMYAGQIIERSDVQSIFDTPLHPYTEALLASNPHLAPEAATLPMIPGTVPAPGSWPAGCRFSARCRYAVAACAEPDIPIDAPYQAHETRCIRYDQLIKT